MPTVALIAILASRHLDRIESNTPIKKIDDRATFSPAQVSRSYRPGTAIRTNWMYEQHRPLIIPIEIVCSIIVAVSKMSKTGERLGLKPTRGTFGFHKGFQFASRANKRAISLGFQGVIFWWRRYCLIQAVRVRRHRADCANGFGWRPLRHIENWMPDFQSLI
jgi:hypothetical protein